MGGRSGDTRTAELDGSGLPGPRGAAAHSLPRSCWRLPRERGRPRLVQGRCGTHTARTPRRPATPGTGRVLRQLGALGTLGLVGRGQGGLVRPEQGRVGVVPGREGSRSSGSATEGRAGRAQGRVSGSGPHPPGPRRPSIAACGSKSPRPAPVGCPATTRTSRISGVATMTSRSGAGGAWCIQATPPKPRPEATPPASPRRGGKRPRSSPRGLHALHADCPGGCVTPSPQAPDLVLPNARAEKRPLPLEPPAERGSIGSAALLLQPPRARGTAGHPWAGRALCPRPCQAVQAFPVSSARAPAVSRPAQPSTLGRLWALLSCLHQSPSLSRVFLSCWKHQFKKSPDELIL